MMLWTASLMLALMLGVTNGDQGIRDLYSYKKKIQNCSFSLLADFSRPYSITL